MNPIKQFWTDFETHFRTAIRELKETGKLKMGNAGFHQDNIVNEILSNMDGLPLTYLHPGIQ